MTDKEKELHMKLNHLIFCLEEWKKIWDPEQPGITKHSRVYYSAFHSFLTRGAREIRKQIDEIKYVKVD